MVVGEYMATLPFNNHPRAKALLLTEARLKEISEELLEKWIAAQWCKGVCLADHGLG